MSEYKRQFEDPSIARAYWRERNREKQAIADEMTSRIGPPAVGSIPSEDWAMGNSEFRDAVNRRLQDRNRYP